MPRSLIKPLLKLTKAQWKSVLRRVSEKEGGAFTKTGMTKFSGLEPPVSEDMGRIYSPRNLGEMYGKLPPGESFREMPDRISTAQTLPLAEARAQYMANPQGTIPGRGEAPLSLLEPTEPSMATPRPTTEEGQIQDLLSSRGISFKQQQFKNVRTPSVEREVATRAATEQSPEVAAAPITEVAKLAAEAETVWKVMGGARSMSGQTWKMQMEMSKYRDRYGTPKEYFESCWLRYNRDPTKFAKSFPRETNLIRQIIETLESGVKEAGAQR